LAECRLIGLRRQFIRLWRQFDKLFRIWRRIRLVRGQRLWLLRLQQFSWRIVYLEQWFLHRDFRKWNSRKRLLDCARPP
jgi:hypothetical protein